MFSLSTWVAIVAVIVAVAAIADSYRLQRAEQKHLQTLEALLDGSRTLRDLLKVSVEEIRQLRKESR